MLNTLRQRALQIIVEDVIFIGNIRAIKLVAKLHHALHTDVLWNHVLSPNALPIRMQFVRTTIVVVAMLISMLITQESTVEFFIKFSIFLFSKVFI